MKTLGLLCKCSDKTDPRSQLSPSIINRAFLIDRLIRPAGGEVFLYSPADIEPDDAPEGRSLAGFRVEGDTLVPDHRPIPAVNANWTYRTRKLLDRGMGYRAFKKWAASNGVSIFVPFAFAEMVSDKRRAFAVVDQAFPGLHPHSEDYIRSPRQIENFFERSEIVFLKPRAGNRGNQIFVLRRKDDAIALKYYDHGEQRDLFPLTLDGAMSLIEAAAGDKNFIIQEGVDSLRFDEAVFDVRVVVVNDSERWETILETRLAPRGSDLSNVFQGGSIRVTEELLREILGPDRAQTLESEIRATSLRLAEHFESHFVGDLMEIGLDFVIDRQLGLHLVEVNAKPGLAGLGSETRIFEWQPDESQAFDRWVDPHVRHLARFLLAKLESTA